MPPKKNNSLQPLSEAEARFAGWIAFQRDNGGHSPDEAAKARKACAHSPLSILDLEDQKEALREKLVHDDYVKGMLERLASGELEVQLRDEMRRHKAGEFKKDIKEGRRTKEQVAKIKAKTEDELRKIEAGTLADELRELSLSEEERTQIEAERTRIGEEIEIWKRGEGRRFIDEWKRAAHSRAAEIIANRGRVAESSGLVLSDFFPSSFGPAWLDTEKVKESDGTLRNLDTREKQEWVEHYKPAEMRLPALYEYARQSVRWLTWACLLSSWKDGPHGMDCELRRIEFEETLPNIGNGGFDSLRALAEHLAADRPFSEIPMEKRKGVAGILANSRNSEVDPDTFTMVDAGPTNAPWLDSLVKTETLRLADKTEATQTMAGRIIDGEHRVCHKYTCDDTLKATTQNDLYGRIKGEAGNWDIVRRGNDDLRTRAINDHGAEVLVLWVNWRNTSNADLADAFERLAKSLRPAKWPEVYRKEERHDQTAEKALRVLLWHRVSASLKACDPKKELELWRKLREAKKKLASLRSRDKKQAVQYFREITGDESAPWWTAKLKK
ncbi:MAG: hypothetical protein IPK22_13470 [Verrucomicrobiaceae bacterium]|nr:hypothetical protein [Verrucomicrobiaceae bacterium]